MRIILALFFVYLGSALASDKKPCSGVTSTGPYNPPPVIAKFDPFATAISAQIRKVPTVSASSADIEEIYWFILGRAPDPEGLKGWIASGKDCWSVMRDVAYSQEARQILTQLENKYFGRALSDYDWNVRKNGLLHVGLSKFETNLKTSPFAIQQPPPPTEQPLPTFVLDPTVEAFNTMRNIRSMSECAYGIQQCQASCKSSQVCLEICLPMIWETFRCGNEAPLPPVPVQGYSTTRGF